jgi:hypothetical protein
MLIIDYYIILEFAGLFDVVCLGLSLGKDRLLCKHDKSSIEPCKALWTIAALDAERPPASRRQGPKKI